MVARVNTVAFQGIDVLDVDVQVQITQGLPSFSVVGLPDKAVAESRERVRAALAAMGLALPPRRITVNLAPADLLKEGSHFDLPIALGLLAAMDVLPRDEIAGYAALGELALDGALAAVAGVLPAAVHASARGLGLICAKPQGGEAAWAAGIEVLAPGSLLALVNHFKGTQVLAPPEPKFCATMARSRSRQRQGPGDGEASDRDRRGGRPQPADDRAARLGQVDAGAAPSRPAAAARAGGGARGQHDPLGGGHAGAGRTTEQALRPCRPTFCLNASSPLLPLFRLLCAPAGWRRRKDPRGQAGVWAQPVPAGGDTRLPAKHSSSGATRARP